MNSKGRSLELFFIDGKPDGMLTAEVFGWTGHVLTSPRIQLKAALNRKEASFTGVYILIGEAQGSGSTIYVGEGEDMKARIRSHDAGKDWWSQAILITTSSNNLNKAHVKYLESRLVETAASIGKVKLDNGNTPLRPSLTEAAQANMEAFLEHVFMVLPAIRVDCFLQDTRPSAAPDAQDSKSGQPPKFEMFLKREGIYATAILQEGEFIVQAGSDARKEWIGDTTDKTSYWKLHGELVDRGILQPNGSNRRFTQNYAFSSTSAAGAVVNGRSTAGPITWKLEGTRKTYKEWEAEQLSE